MRKFAYRFLYMVSGGAGLLALATHVVADDGTAVAPMLVSLTTFVVAYGTEAKCSAG